MQISENPYAAARHINGVNGASALQPGAARAGVRSGVPESLPARTEYRADPLRSQYKGEVYGADARLGFENALGSSGRARPAETAGLFSPDPAEERTINRLQARDQQVRSTEQAKGEAVGGEQYIYQQGPDGALYAIGTAPHLVSPHGSGAGGVMGSPIAAFPVESSEGRAHAGGRTGEGGELTDKLESRDQEVRRHEHAHLAAAGTLASGLPEYDYQVGPDGKRYAVGGSVNIMLSSVPGDPEATKRNADAVIRAASAPGSPSGQDVKVAEDARRMRFRADAEAQRLHEEKLQENKMNAEMDGGKTANLRRALAAYSDPRSANRLIQGVV